MPTFASLFSGGGGADIGALQAGYTPLWAVECDAAIAEWHTRNLPDTQMIVAPVQGVDYRTLPVVDWLHASPPCPNFSVAKDDAAETKLDIEMAQATTHAIQEQQPPVFSLEQVYGYRESVSFALIVWRGAINSVATTTVRANRAFRGAISCRTHWRGVSEYKQSYPARCRDNTKWQYRRRHNERIQHQPRSRPVAYRSDVIHFRAGQVSVRPIHTDRQSRGE